MATYAASAGDWRKLQQLLDSGADVEKRTSNGWTPLQLAVEAHSVKCVQVLLAHNADVNCVCGVRKMAPLHLAAFQGSVHILELLLNHGADINAKSGNGSTPLHAAADGNSAACAVQLIKRGADVNIPRADGMLAIQVAAAAGNNRVARAIEHPDSFEIPSTAPDVDMTDETDSADETSGEDEGEDDQSGVRLLQASQSGNLGAVQMLLSSGAPVNFCGYGNWSPLLVAAEHGHVQIAQTLLQHGADVGNTAGARGNTALHLAAFHRNADIVRLLLQHKADPNAVSVDGSTPLHTAVMRGSLECAQLLVSAGADVNAVRRDGCSVAQLLNGTAQTDIARLLLDSGAQDVVVPPRPVTLPSLHRRLRSDRHSLPVMPVMPFVEGHDPMDPMLSPQGPVPVPVAPGRARPVSGFTLPVDLAAVLSALRSRYAHSDDAAHVCQFPGCSRPCAVAPDGSRFRFCGRTHAMMAGEYRGAPHPCKWGAACWHMQRGEQPHCSLFSHPTTTLVPVPDSMVQDLCTALQNRNDDEARSLFLQMLPLASGINRYAESVRRVMEDSCESIRQQADAALQAHSEFQKGPEYVRQLLDVRRDFVLRLRACTENNALVVQAVDEGLGTVTYRPFGVFGMSELLSRFCDLLLRGKLAVKDEQLQPVLEDVHAVVSYLADANVFFAFYRRALAARLLKGTVNREAENTAATMFKSEYEGNKIIRMLQDCEEASARTDQFRAVSGSAIDGDVHVLHSRCWPTTRDPPACALQLPPVLEARVQQFERFYRQHVRDSCRLSWVHSLGRVTLVINYAAGKRDLTCSTHQAAILLLFQQQDHWTFRAIQQQLCMSPEYLQQCVGPLCGAAPGKYRFLLRSGAGDSVQPDETLSFNVRVLDEKPPRRVTLPPVAAVL